MSGFYDEQIKRPFVPKECQICSNFLQNVTLYECNHAVICSKCFVLLNKKRDRRCVVCRKTSEVVIITTRKAYLHQDYTDYKRHVELKLKPLLFDESIGAFFSDEGHRDKLLREFKLIVCPICNAGKVQKCSKKNPIGVNEFASIAPLQKHLEDSHQLCFCDLCLSHSEVFLKDQKLYSFSELQKHKEIEHPRCPFCNYSVYNDAILGKHFHEQHYRCRICEFSAVRISCGIAREFFEFYKDESDLAKHHNSWHFVCPKCPHIIGLFGTIDGLQKHLIECHSGALVVIPDHFIMQNRIKDFTEPKRLDGNIQILALEGTRVTTLRYYPGAAPVMLNQEQTHHAENGASPTTRISTFTASQLPNETAQDTKKPYAKADAGKADAKPCADGEDEWTVTAGRRRQTKNIQTKTTDRSKGVKIQGKKDGQKR